MTDSWLTTLDSLLMRFQRAPERVVSLIPSVTESLFVFGLGDSVVGVTDFCLPDATQISIPARIGGTKSPDADRILGLKPDLIIANQEENSREALETLAGQGIPIWLTFPRSVSQAMEDLFSMVRLFRQESRLAPRLELLEKTLEWTSLVDDQQPRPRFFCPIWKGENPIWWMTFNRDTYAHDLLSRCGGENIFADRARRYPLAADLGQAPAIEDPDKDTRYPCVSPSEVAAAEPDIILLPSEPFKFTQSDLLQIRELLADTPAVASGRIHVLDGRLITWHGIQLAKALTILPGLFHAGSE